MTIAPMLDWTGTTCAGTPRSARTQMCIRDRAEGFERALRTWSTRPPTEEQRATLLKLVLELNVEAIALGR